MKDNSSIPNNTLKEAELLKIIQELKEQNLKLETNNKELLQEKQNLSAILKGTNIGIWQWNLTTNEILYDDQYLEMIGYNSEEFLPFTINNWKGITHPEDLKKSDEIINKHINGELDFYECELRIKHKNGNCVWILDKGKIVQRDENGKPLIISGTHQDITERKLTEISLRESEEMLKTVFENSAIGIEIFDKNSYLKKTNKKIDELFGTNSEELIDKYNLKNDPNYQYPEVWEQLQKGNQVQHEIKLFFDNVQYPTKKSGTAYYNLIATPIPDTISDNIGYLMQVIDITQNKEIEENIKLSQITYSGILNSISELIYIQDENGCFLDINKATEKRYGYKKEYFIGKTPEFLSAPGKNDFDKIFKAIQLAWKGEKQSFEFWGITKNGEIFPKKVNLSLGTYFGKPAIIAVARDITKQKLTEIALKESEERYRHIVESANEGISVSQGTHLRFVNAKVAELLGYTKKELLSIPFIEFIHPDHRELIANNYKKRLNGEILENNYHVKVLSKEKITRWFEFSAVKIEWEGKPATMSFVTDITDRKNAEEALLQTNERNVLISNATNDALWDWNFHTNRVWWNKGLTELFGYVFENNETSSEWWAENIHPDDKERAENFYLDIINSKEETWETEYQFKCADGTYAYVYDRGIIKRDQNGKPIRMMGAMMDITKRKQAEAALLESEERYRSLVEWTTECIVVHKDGKIIYANPAAHKAIGASNDYKLIGKPIIDFIHPDHHQMMTERLKKFVKISDTTPVMEGKFIKLDGSTMYVETQAIMINYNGSPAIQASIRDITSHKEAEILIIKAKEQAEESDRLKSAFLANMSHEIRTPMNGILGFTNLLKEKNLTLENQQEYIKIIDQSGERLLNIINDIIDISKIESNQMLVYTTEININEKITFLYNFFKPEATAKEIQLNYHNDLPQNKAFIFTDGEKITAILTNLVKNALKFCDKGVINFGYEVKRNNKSDSNEITELEFYVKDTGIGIPNDRIHAIFDRFIQADLSDKRAFQGAGLGLSISKAYVEMLGGKIWVDSEVGIGSSFYFTIPYNTVQKTKNTQKENTDNKNFEIKVKNLKTLIVEDDAISKLLISKSVSKFSKEVMAVKNGIQAIEACQNNPDIDLIMMDINMPDMNGYEATKQIRQFNKKVIIIAQTANAFASDKSDALAAGCNDYISKPININLLYEIVNKYFS